MNNIKFFTLFLLLTVFLTACNLSTPTDEPTLTPEPTIQVTTLPTRTEITSDNTPPVAATNTTVNIIRPTVAAPTANPLFTGTPLPIGERPATDTAPQPFPTIVLTMTATDTSAFTFPTTYPSVYPVTLRQGQTLLVNYDVTIYNPGQGRVYLVVRDPTGHDIYKLVITETTQDTAEVPVSVGGQHQILAAPENISGQYSVTYGFRN